MTDDAGARTDAVQVDVVAENAQQVQAEMTVIEDAVTPAATPAEVVATVKGLWSEGQPAPYDLYDVGGKPVEATTGMAPRITRGTTIDAATSAWVHEWLSPGTEHDASVNVLTVVDPA